MSTQPGAPPAGGQNSNRNWIVVAVAALLLFCCCTAVIVPIAWSCGDMFMGSATQCAPLLPK